MVHIHILFKSVHTMYIFKLNNNNKLSNKNTDLPIDPVGCCISVGESVVVTIGRVCTCEVGESVC